VSNRFDDRKEGWGQPLGFGRGRTAFSRSRVRRRSSRRCQDPGGPPSGACLPLGAASAHVAYLERDGVTRDGEKGRTFSATGDRTDAVAFARRGLHDRHHFRFAVTPEDAAEMTDSGLHPRPARSGWRAISARLDWVRIARWNTDNPHMHLVVRGVAGDGSDLVVSRDYISHSNLGRSVVTSRARPLVSGCQLTNFSSGVTMTTYFTEGLAKFCEEFVSPPRLESLSIPRRSSAWVDSRSSRHTIILDE
jgi:hypothetical protein